MHRTCIIMYSWMAPTLSVVSGAFEQPGISESTPVWAPPKGPFTPDAVPCGGKYPCTASDVNESQVRYDAFTHAALRWDHHHHHLFAQSTSNSHIQQCNIVEQDCKVQERTLTAARKRSMIWQQCSSQSINITSKKTWKVYFGNTRYKNR